ncbi:kinase-like protein [Nadsonia fulvescens var. elongata DSM 6958]|uniref:Kinase-like protein n=1 Tax=Nadsonia fulvescens var. elongata DSM 6958 TaxID=857566 RepID=A0A1E3PNI5_9ASCO|nr:kinase-like protein [Nadsonia fulvescens var. elongata DSM 6958]
MYKNHLFLVFELLSSNLYEFIKQNEYKGFSLGVIRVFSSQLLDALKLLNQAKIVHCDLKPENILLKSLGMLDIKIIDLGSACYEQQTIYTYIQSRFYRAPEIILGIPYNTSIDMWSLGCIVAELFLGLPLFPGSSEYNQLSRIIQTIGMPPNWMIEKGKNSTNFFTRITDTPSQRYRLKSLDEYSKEQNVEEVAGKKYLASTDLEQNIMSYPLPRTDMTNLEIEQEMKDRKLLINFIQGLLNYNPLERWTPQQALSHPFIIGSNKSAGGTITLPSVTKSSNLDTGFRDLVNDNTKHTTLKLSKPSIDLNNKKPFIGHPSSGSSEIYDITSISHVQSNQKKNRYDDIKSYDCDLNSKMQFNLKL